MLLMKMILLVLLVLATTARLKKTNKTNVLLSSKRRKGRETAETVGQKKKKGNKGKIKRRGVGRKGTYNTRYWEGRRRRRDRERGEQRGVREAETLTFNEKHICRPRSHFALQHNPGRKFVPYIKQRTAIALKAHNPDNATRGDYS